MADTTAFARCLQANPEPPRIEAGLALSQRLGVRGTPTVLVNGWRFETPPNARDLIRTLDELLAGRKPSLAGLP